MPYTKVRVAVLSLPICHPKRLAPMHPQICCVFADMSTRLLACSLMNERHTPSSIVTFFHHGSSARLDCAFTTLSASPTCLRSLTSRCFNPASRPFVFSFSFIAFAARFRLPALSNPACLPTRVNPEDEGESALYALCATATAAPPLRAAVHSSFMTGRCHCRGSEEDERRLRWR